MAVSVLLAPMAARLQERHPRLSVRIQEPGVPESFDLLFEGEIDLAIVEATPHNPPLSDARYDQQPLLDDPFDLVVPEGHPLAARELDRPRAGQPITRWTGTSPPIWWPTARASH
ncbi:hypothetical protein GCM10022403_050430 [Streptomyces coacervatus]|uniref:LysR substrate-binding domain-containing protein n=1 Tax=Streptomyces coacervatus TaxID=647381 RepID=A0ABP7I2V0_9ACTN